MTDLEHELRAALRDPGWDVAGPAEPDAWVRTRVRRTRIASIVVGGVVVGALGLGAVAVAGGGSAPTERLGGVPPTSAPPPSPVLEPSAQLALCQGPARVPYGACVDADVTRLESGPALPLSSDRLLDCGRYELGRLATRLPGLPLQCLASAFEAGEPAVLSFSSLTTEGDPIIEQFEVLATGQVLWTVDSRADRFGVREVSAQPCAGLSVETGVPRASGCSRGTLASPRPDQVAVTFFLVRSEDGLLVPQTRLVDGPATASSVLSSLGLTDPLERNRGFVTLVDSPTLLGLAEPMDDEARLRVQIDTRGLTQQEAALLAGQIVLTLHRTLGTSSVALEDPNGVPVLLDLDGSPRMSPFVPEDFASLLAP